MTQPAIDRTSIVSQVESVLAREVRGETVLLDLQAEQYYALNETGTLVWQLIAGGAPLAEICNRMGQRYAVEPQQIEDDLMDLLRALHDAGLVSISAAGRPTPQ